MFQDGLNHVCIVVDAELVGHGQEQHVCLGDGFVLLELFDQNVRLGRVASAENGALFFAQTASIAVMKSIVLS